ncbi:peptidase S14 [Thioclava dalianensis]|uniref:ATP-dependent Clp protease proteolytic subunit n=1 Tax=Thioclava dalianensis TaxID=1185766 RepID=A0A074TD46_9RHOB|nr:head maturation protease, ClpP-related [Thioclava dalianensis]KEP69624.1 peptidase S14 [Thioclava dalianensis]SFN16012.1 ATP-dependent protease ClpP, protease subunit [Thioclava dalianensis]
MAVIVEDGQLTLTGYVGESTLEIDGWVIFDGFTHAEVVAALGEFGPDEDLVVHINSGGGVATEGTAIRSALADREGRTDVVIDGIAASAASLIAMAGDTVSMSLGSLLMIHDPSGFTWGTVEDHEKTIKGLNSLGNTYARVYARKSGKSDADCRAIMRVETWFTPEEAVAAGFVDRAIDDAAEAVAAFPYQHYAHAPRDLVAMAKSNNWRPPVPVTAGSKPNVPTLAKEKETPTMAQKPNAAATPAPPAAPAPSATAVSADQVKARIKAITEDDAAQGHEALAKHLAFDTDMPAEEAVAALKAAASDAPVKPTEDVPDAASYQARRSAASDLAQPAPGPQAKPKAAINTGGIYAARRNAKEV